MTVYIFTGILVNRLEPQYSKIYKIYVSGPQGRLQVEINMGGHQGPRHLSGIYLFFYLAKWRIEKKRGEFCYENWEKGE